MKKIRICLEIPGLAEDEYGNPRPGGLCITLGGDCEEEITGEEHKKLMRNLDIKQVLKMACLDEFCSAEDCRILTPDEYDKEYGEEANHDE